MISNDTNFDSFIKTVKKQGKLALFTGAGINAGIIPLWDDLIDNLLNYCTKYFSGFLLLEDREKAIVVEKMKSLNNYEKASIIKTYLKSEYLPALHEILYSKFGEIIDLDKLQKTNSFLFKVSKLAQNPKVTAIISYNYDEILSKFITKGGRQTVNIFGSTSDMPEFDNKLPVYYIHGFVPLHQRIPESENSSVVLSQDEYFNYMTNSHSWQTVYQLNYLMSIPCLFIGCSMKDINMLRLLTLAQKGKSRLDVYSLFSNIYYTDKVSNNSAKTLFNIQKLHLAEFGVRVIEAGNSYKDLPTMVEKINNELCT